jgi:hypothetical protein
LACFFKPDIFIFSILLALCTFFVAMKLNHFRDSPFLAWKVRVLCLSSNALLLLDPSCDFRFWGCYCNSYVHYHQQTDWTGRSKSEIPDEVAANTGGPTLFR